MMNDRHRGASLRTMPAQCRSGHRRNPARHIDIQIARRAAPLAGHGVLVTGTAIRAVHQRAVALEQRCRAAWMVRAAGSTAESAVSNAWLDKMSRSDGNAYLGFWEAAARQALRDEPDLLDHG
jgi:hypothetical protein